MPRRLPLPPMPDMTEVSPAVRLPAGFRFAGLACGVKASGKPDLTLIAGDGELVSGAVYTTNQIVAAPVVLSRSRTPSTRIRALVVNSGNANACTGRRGVEDAQAMCDAVATQLGCQANQVLVMSTGIIGRPLPIDRIQTGIQQAATQLDASQDAFYRAADAILTTDQGRKVVLREIDIDHTTYHLAGMAKGAGMIAPNMATMLAAMLTDVPLTSDDAQRLISRAADVSFNCVSVDGHTSTNDSLALLSSGVSLGRPALSPRGVAIFEDHLQEACIELAKQLPADGEGATHVLEVVVSGAASDADAAVIAREVAASPLVKTAIAGGDPNWGRIVSAAGYAGPTIDPGRTSLRIVDSLVFESGTPVPFDAADVSRQIRQSPFVRIELTVGDGPGSTRFWASDLTVDYVKFNADYST